MAAEPTRPQLSSVPPLPHDHLADHLADHAIDGDADHVVEHPAEHLVEHPAMWSGEAEVGPLRRPWAVAGQAWDKFGSRCPRCCRCCGCPGHVAGRNAPRNDAQVW